MSDPFSNLDPATEPATKPSAGEPATTPYAAATGPTPSAPTTAPGAPFASVATTASGATTAYDTTTASGATMSSGASAVPDTRRNRPLFGTIFWGVVLLTFAGLMAVQALFPVTLDPTLWLVGSVLVIGLLLVVAGIAAAARRTG